MGFDFSKYDLVIADCDGTLYAMDSLDMLPWTKMLVESIKSTPRKTYFVIASNQGSVSCAEAGWSTSHKYPTLDQVTERFEKIRFELKPDEIYLAFAFYSSKSRMWCFPSSLPEDDIRCSRAWRKPGTGMIEAARDQFGHGCKILFIGDSEDDEGAARNAGCEFINVLDLVKEMGIG